MSTSNLATKIADLPIILPAHVVPMLRDEGIITLEDWCSLGERRWKLFGIAGSTVEKLDLAVVWG